MGFLNKQPLNYISAVEKFFLTLKDSGLFLSSNDYHLISRWEQQGIPVNTVCRAIEKGFHEQKKRNRKPFAQKVSLSSLEKFIESEFKQA